MISCINGNKCCAIFFFLGGGVVRKHTMLQTSCFLRISFTLDRKCLYNLPHTSCLWWISFSFLYTKSSVCCSIMLIFPVWSVAISFCQKEKFEDFFFFYKISFSKNVVFLTIRKYQNNIVCWNQHSPCCSTFFAITARRNNENINSLMMELYLGSHWGWRQFVSLYQQVLLLWWSCGHLSLCV